MAFLLGEWFKNEDDNLNDLPVDLRDIYTNPWKVLGVTEASEPWTLRDAFRQRCIQMTPAFTGGLTTVGTGRYTFRQILFAFRLCTGELAGPAKKLSLTLERSPLLNNKPWDILHVLRPLMTKGSRVASTARASRMMAVRLRRPESAFDSKGVGGILRAIFAIEVSYCMRNHCVQRSYADFEELHRKLAAELVVLPCFPQGGGVTSLVGGRHDLGRELCGYVQRVHNLLAQRGVFSPRVMEFLDIDHVRVHVEEEGRVVGESLDSRSLLPNTCWQVVEEPWLAKWRKFILGRGARRYHAPGAIDNRLLFASESSMASVSPEGGGVDDPARRERGSRRRRAKEGAGLAEHRRGANRLSPRKGLVLGEDYCVVNFNVWQYWMMVYGGGPSVGRASKGIYGQRAIAHLEAVVKVQAAARGFLGRKRFWREYLMRLANENAGSKEALYEKAVRDTRAAAMAHIKAAKHRRVRERLTRAAVFTQVGWRRKKGYTYQVDKLETQQHIQDVFEKSDNSIQETPSNRPMVVREVKGIVNIGGAEEYVVRLDEDTGIDIGLRKRGGHHRGVIRAGSEEKNVMTRGNEGVGEQTVVFEVPRELRDTVKRGSVLLAVNNVPVITMSHERAMAHIRQAAWPLLLKFRLPLDEGDAFSLAKIVDIRDDGHFSEDIVLEHLKRKLLRGQTLLRFPARTSLIGGKPYITRLSIDEHNLYYEGRERASCPEGSRRSILLYDLKFVRRGKGTPTLRRGAGSFPEDVCFSLATKTKVLDFAVPAPVPDDGKSDKRCELLVWGLKKLIHEIQGSQVYVDKDGAVKRRVRPKNTIKTVVHRQQHQQHQQQHQQQQYQSVHQ